MFHQDRLEVNIFRNQEKIIVKKLSPPPQIFQECAYILNLTKFMFSSQVKWHEIAETIFSYIAAAVCWKTPLIFLDIPQFSKGNLRNVARG